MIDFMSSWAEQIILAVIIATIIEMLLPKSNNQKYIKMMIGIYILFNIISPIIENKDNFSIEKYDLENYEIEKSSMDKRIEKIYLEELEGIVISKFEENSFEVSKCVIDAVLDTNDKNAGISSITVKIKNGNDKNKIDQIRSELATEFEIEEKKIIIR